MPGHVKIRRVSRGRSLPLVALVLALATLIATVRVVAGGETWADVRYHTQVAPPRLAAAAAIEAGELPAWWEGTSLGVPLAGEPSHGAMAPATWLASSPRALDLILVIHLFWLALGVAVWARRTTSETAAVVAGLLAITAGVVASTAVRGALPALAHLPWLGAAAAHLRVDRRAAIAIGALVGVIGLGGELAILVDALALALVVGYRRDTRAWLGAGLAAGLAIGLAQWLPALLALPHAAGSEVAAIPLSRLVELVVPASFGASDPDRGLLAIGGAAAWAPSLHVGVALLALAAVRPITRRFAILLGALGVLALVVGRGGWPGWLGAPELHVAVLAILLATLAAEGVDALVAGERRGRLALAIGAACALVALIALAIYRGNHEDARPAIDRALVDGGLGIACMVAAIALATGKLQPVALALLVAPGFGAGRSTAPTSPALALPRWAELAQDEQVPRRLYRPDGLHEGPEAPELRHFETLDEALATLSGASADRFGITAARSDDPARARWHDRTWTAASHGGGVLLDRFGIGLAILPSSVAARGFTALGARGRWSLVQVPVAPVAAVVAGVRYALDPDRALGLMFTADGHAGIPRGTIVVAGSGDSRDSPIGPRPCRIQRWEPGDLALACTAERAGFAVVSSSATPGWSVTVDGAEAEALDADVLRRAVAIAPGTHAIRWRYTAPGLLAGLACAALGLLGLVGLGALTLPGTRRRASRASS